MPLKLRTKRPDPVLKQIAAVLKKYETAHPHANIEVYRQNNVSVRIRVIDPSYAKKGWAEREEELWKLLLDLPDEVVADISMILMLTPEEAKESFASKEFDDPIPSPV
jgi:hypothetical protein